jgi:hypothetical protein
MSHGPWLGSHVTVPEDVLLKQVVPSPMSGPVTQSRLWVELYQKKVVTAQAGMTSHSGGGITVWRGVSGVASVKREMARRESKRHNRVETPILKRQVGGQRDLGEQRTNEVRLGVAMTRKTTEAPGDIPTFYVKSDFHKSPV